MFFSFIIIIFGFAKKKKNHDADALFFESNEAEPTIRLALFNGGSK